MSEIEEIKEQIKEAGTKPPRRRIGKRGKIAIVATALVIAILIDAGVAIVTAPKHKYTKPDNKFVMPDVDWNTLKSSYVVKRTLYNDISGTVINQTIGSKKSNGDFRVEIVVNICCYIYTPHYSDSIRIGFYVSFKKLGGDYRVKELIFKYNMSDEEVVAQRTPLVYVHSTNLYFMMDPYKTPAYENTVDYEWIVFHRRRGINKDAKDIKEGGFSNNFDIYLYDEYPHWYNHTITLSAILVYGKYVQGWLGSGWQDVHELSTSVMIYVVPEGGE